MKIVDTTLLDQVSKQAQSAPRLRKNLNFHPSDDFVCHRLLNAFEPGSYIPPHRHIAPTQDETIIVIRGRIGIIGFDDRGNIALTAILQPGGEAVAVDIDHGEYHTLVSLEAGTVFFEAKAGPYRPRTREELAAWAPEEGTADAATYLSQLRSLFP